MPLTTARAFGRHIFPSRSNAVFMSIDTVPFIPLFYSLAPFENGVMQSSANMKSSGRRLRLATNKGMNSSRFDIVCAIK
jgi:hypothetical protein